MVKLTRMNTYYKKNPNGYFARHFRDIECSIPVTGFLLGDGVYYSIYVKNGVIHNPYGVAVLHTSPFKKVSYVLDGEEIYRFI